MSVTAGELFINLGVKGADKTVGALTDIKKGLGEASSMSLEAKAAIVGAVYALERLFSISGAAGTGLTNFNALLGVSTKTLQQYQYAARQAGVANEDVEGTFKSIQATMTKTLTNQGKPSGLARVGQVSGYISEDDIKKYQSHPEELLRKLQDYAQKEQNIGLRNQVLRSFGISDAMISGLARNAFTPAQLKKGEAYSYSDKEIAALNKAHIAWDNTLVKIEMAVGKFNAKFGPQLATDIDKLVTPMLHLAEAVAKLVEAFAKSGLLEKTIDFLANGLERTAILVGGSDKERKKLSDAILKEMKEKGSKGDLIQQYGIGNRLSTSEIVRQGLVKGAIPLHPTNHQNVNVHQKIDIHGHNLDSHKIGKSIEQHTSNAARQFPSQMQVC